MKKIFCFASFHLFFLSLLSAQVVLTACIENELVEKVGNEATVYFENQLLDSFFNEGLIVTNIPYAKLTFEDWKKANISTFSIESEVDYLIMLYFSYKKGMKYNAFTRKNLLPCEKIYCKILKKGTKEALYMEEFVLEDLTDAGIYKKLDFCVEKVKMQIIEQIRGKI